MSKPGKLTTKEKAFLYDNMNREVRELAITSVLHHMHAILGREELRANQAFVEEFVRDWRPLTVVIVDGLPHILDAERAAEVACGFAWDLGAAQAENERLRERLAKYEATP